VADDGKDKRREGRFPARIVARLQRQGQPVDLLTNNVSFKGAFVRTDAPPQLRQLVRLSFATPDGRAVNVHAMVVYVVEPGDPERVPGVGVQFWGPMDQPKVWEGYVQDLRIQAKEGTLAASEVDKVRRGSERFRLTLDVVLDGTAGQTRDLSLTGMAIRTELPFEVGMNVLLSVTTPNHGVLEIRVTVRRAINEPSFKGVGVEFVDVSPEIGATLRAIIAATAADSQPVFGNPGDPRLH
jgi:Tfp pilus assembly protein PilZ